MSETLWTSDEAAAATGGRATADFTASGVTIDSRAAKPGDLFVALADIRDGHDFVSAAFKAGAAAALVTHIPEGAPDDAPYLIVDDTLEALRALAAAARARTEATVIGVTGSVGKTGVKEMLRAALDASGKTHAAEKSFNNHWGAPLTLARMPADTEFAVIELGMNHAGEIGPLSRLARPDIALITTVEAVHLEHFSGVEEIADAKAEIFEGMNEGGVAILNADNDQFDRLTIAAAARGLEVVDFGARPGVEAHLESARVTSAATVVRASMGQRPLVFKIGAPGRHFALNALAALAAVRSAGADLARACMALGRWTPPAGRGSRIRISFGPGGLDGGVTLIDESYNANPVSMRAALAVLSAAAPEDGIGRVSKGRRIAFLGDMLELGPDAKAMHAGLATAEEIAGVDVVHCCGPLMRALYDALPPSKRGKWFEDSAALAAAAGRKLDAGDVAMVKGSLGAKMALVVTAITQMGEAAPANEDGVNAF